MLVQTMERSPKEEKSCAKFTNTPSYKSISSAYSHNSALDYALFKEKLHREPQLMQ